MKIRTFHLQRDSDPSGVTGVGIVAIGVQFPNGRCVISWVDYCSAIGVYENIQQLTAIHGHGGNTKVVWQED